MADFIHGMYPGLTRYLAATGSSTEPTANNFVLDATTDKCEFIFRAKEAATITRLGCRLGAIIGTTPTYRISLQGVSSGVSDGTIKGATNNALATFSPSSLGWSSGTWHWLTLTESATIARGDLLSVVIDYSSGTVSGVNDASFTTHWGWASLAEFPYAIQNNAGSRSTQGGLPCFGYGSAGTAYGFPIETIGTLTINNGTTPDEVAMKFSLTAGWSDTFKIGGVFHPMRFNSTSCSLVTILYDTDGTTTLQNVTHAGTEATAANVVRAMLQYFDEATLSTLTFGNTHRLSFQPANANSVVIPYGDVAAAADWDAWPGGQNFTYSSRTDAGAWSDLTTRKLFMDLVIDDWTEPTGGGTSGGFIIGG